MILVIDNHDSFTWTIVDYLRVLGAEVEVVRNDAIDAEQALASGADGLVISPGPGGPDEAGISVALVGLAAEAKRPLLGICLGHQAIARHFGGTVERGPPVHGKTSEIAHDGTGLFAGLPTPLTATRYHSLHTPEATMPHCLRVNARAGGVVMGFAHRDLPIHGVQFHPESIASAHGHALLANFLALGAGAG